MAESNDDQSPPESNPDAADKAAQSGAAQAGAAQAGAAQAGAAQAGKTGTAAEVSDKPDATARQGASAEPSDHKRSEDIERLLDEATESLEQAAGSDVSPQATPKPFSLGDLTPGAADEGRQSIDLLGEVEMDLRIELGRTQMRLEDVLQLRGGSVVALDKLAGDPVDVFVNGRLIARGEVLVMNDNFCIRVTELVGV